MRTDPYDIVIVGGGFTGLTAAYVLSKQGRKVRVIESDTTTGGLAGTFQLADGLKLEKFYHHWFNNDVYVSDLVSEMGMESALLTLPSRTGMYFNGKIWNLSTPIDLLRFNAISFFERLRLGFLVFQVRRVVDWRKIEHISIREWLEPLCGKNVFSVMSGEPLIRAKFSIYAEAINAVWMWKKLVLRGSTRNVKGGEELKYFKGGIGSLTEAMVSAIEQADGEVSIGEKVIGVQADDDRLLSLYTERGEVAGRHFLFTPAFSIIADIFEGAADPAWLASLRRVRYLGNLCLVLRLKHSLSDTYWLNVNDPGFPFVGVIEHTNFDTSDYYNGTSIVYLSRYLVKEDPVWSYSNDQYFDFALKHLLRMFPKMDRSWVLEHHLWRAQYAQPVTECEYSRYVPGRETPFINASISTMAQIYPEDRGTNYAIREGRSVAEYISKLLNA